MYQWHLPPFERKEKNSQQIGDLVHSDICGPITPPTSEGHKYIQVFLDDYSHYFVVKLLKNKSEAEINLKDYIGETKRQHNIKIKRLRLGNGGEYTSKQFKNFCRQNGINLEYTIPYSSQSNGKAECMNRTLFNMVRTKVVNSGIPKYLWEKLLNVLPMNWTDHLQVHLITIKQLN